MKGVNLEVRLLGERRQSADADDDGRQFTVIVLPNSWAKTAVSINIYLKMSSKFGNVSYTTIWVYIP